MRHLSYEVKIREWWNTMCKKLGKGGKKPTWVNKELLSLLKNKQEMHRRWKQMRLFAINTVRLPEYIEVRQGRSRPICPVTVHSYTCICSQRVCVSWQHILSAGTGSVPLSSDTQAWKTRFLQRFKDFRSMLAYCQSKTIPLWQIMTNHSCSSE